MVVVAVWNPKGGVGKSTATTNLAFLAAAGGERTMVWDLDAQGAAAHLLGVGGGTSIRAKRLVKGKADLPEAIQPTPFPNLEVVPAGMGLRRIDRLLGKHGGSARFLRDALQPVEKTYRWVFWDCPAGMSALVEAAIESADLVLVPVVPDPLCVRSYEAMIVFMERSRPQEHRLIPFLSMVESRNVLHRRLADIFRVREPTTCQTSIPRRAEVLVAARRRLPIAAARPSSKVAAAYRSLWAEIRSLRPPCLSNLPGQPTARRTGRPPP